MDRRVDDEVGWSQVKRLSERGGEWARRVDGLVQAHAAGDVPQVRMHARALLELRELTPSLYGSGHLPLWPLIRRLAEYGR